MNHCGRQEAVPEFHELLIPQVLARHSHQSCGRVASVELTFQRGQRLGLLAAEGSAHPPATKPVSSLLRWFHYSASLVSLFCSQSGHIDETFHMSMSTARKRHVQSAQMD
eukprot:2935339-Rhodomonas_salina.2